MQSHMGTIWHVYNVLMCHKCCYHCVLSMGESSIFQVLHSSVQQPFAAKLSDNSLLQLLFRPESLLFVGMYSAAFLPASAKPQDSSAQLNTLLHLNLMMFQDFHNARINNRGNSTGQRHRGSLTLPVFAASKAIMPTPSTSPPSKYHRKLRFGASTVSVYPDSYVTRFSTDA